MFLENLLDGPCNDLLMKGLGDDGYYWYQSSDEERASDTTYYSSDGSRFGNNPAGSFDDLINLVEEDQDAISINDEQFMRTFMRNFVTICS